MLGATRAPGRVMPDIAEITGSGCHCFPEASMNPLAPQRDAAASTGLIRATLANFFNIPVDCLLGRTDTADTLEKDIESAISGHPDFIKTGRVCSPFSGKSDP